MSEEEVSIELYNAAYGGNVKKVDRLLLAADCDRMLGLSAKFGCGEDTALHAACRGKGNLDVVRALLVAKANLEATDKKGRTPLFDAIRHERAEIVKVLLERGANLEAKNKSGWTPMHYACAYLDSAQMLRVLISAGGDVKAKTIDGSTPLILASLAGSLPQVTELLDIYDGNLDYKDHFGNTALHKASIRNELRVVEYLVGRGANIYTKNNNGMTPLDLAIALSNTDVAEFLLQHYQQNGSILSILQKASYSGGDDDSDDGDYEEGEEEETARFVVTLPIGKLEMDQLLEMLTYFVAQDPTAIRTQDSTNFELPLHVACCTRAPIEVLRFVVDQDPASLYSSDGSGCSPLHAACRAGAPLETLQFLVEAGSARTVFARDHNGALPLHLLCKAQPSVDAIKYMVRSHLTSASIKTDDGDLPVMVAVKSKASESVILELSLANPPGLEYFYQFYKMYF